MSKQSRFEKNVIILFIIAGVSRHWNYHDNTKLATPQQKATQIQEKAQNDTGCESPYQNAY